MQETSIQILLAEYDRLKTLELFWLESLERALQLYLTAITAAGGILLLLLSPQTAPSSSSISASLLFGIVLLVGEVTFLRLMGIDLRLTENAKGYLLIRDRFGLIDPELASVFLKGMVQDKKRYSAWSSISGIIIRTLTISQQKTTVVFLNCLVSAGLAVTIIWPSTLLGGLIVVVFVATLIGLLHIAYASWRYKRSVKSLSTNAITYWI